MAYPRQWKSGAIKARGLSDLHPETLADEPRPPGPGKSWGFHLLMDMSQCNEKIDDEAAVENFFTQLIAELKMQPLSEIMIKQVEGGEAGRGISAVQMITTSSITFHSDDDKRSVYLDVFSCKEFDPKTVEKFACNYFQPSKHAAQLIYRDAGLSAKGK